MNQALEQGLAEEWLVRLRAAHDVAEQMADGLYRAQGVPLLCHLVRTASIVLAERRPPPVVLASLLHAAYLLQEFEGAGRRAPSRAILHQTIGDYAESLVSDYRCFPWFSQARLEDHLRDLDGYEERERDLLLIRLANELEDHLDRAMAYTPPERAGRHAAAYGPQTVELASRLGRPELAAELREAIGDGVGPRIPLAIVLPRREGYAHHPGVVAQLQDLLHRVRVVARREGPSGLFFRMLERFGYRRVGWFARGLDPLRPNPARTPIDVVRLGPGDLDAYLGLRPDSPPRLFFGRLEAGGICFAARHAGRIVSVTWIATGHAQLSTGELVLRDGEVFLYDSFTDPELRGHHIQMTVLAALLDHARAAGHQRAVVMIEPVNRPSIRSRERSGFRRTGTMHFLRLGKKSWTLLHGERSP
jgi:GNAT superfamily N-acetyltransferase